MAKIYKVSDKIKVNVDDVVITISPLTSDQKNEVQMIVLEKGSFGAMESARLAIKYALKDIDGVENSDGSPYKLSFEDGFITNENLDDLLNLHQSTAMTLVCMNLLQGVPKIWLDPGTGKELEGVSYYKEKKRKK